VIELRSYRRVFELERRIYRIDRLRLNPGGVPVRGVVYFLALVALSVLAGAFPLTAALASAVPWYLRALVLPGLGAGLLALVRLEGRPFHLAARALLGYAASSRRLAGLAQRSSVGARWVPPDILMLPDGSDARIRRFRYTGPGAVLVTVVHERIEGAAAPPSSGLSRRRQRGALIVRELASPHPPAEGQVVTLGRRTRVVTLGSAATRARRQGRSTARRWRPGGEERDSQR